MTNIFENCSYHSIYEPFLLNCTNTTEQCYLIRYVDTIQELNFWLNTVIPIILLSIALILNIYFLFILVPEYIEMSDVVRKQYVFVLSRGVSMLTATSAELVIRCVPVPSIDYTFFFLFFIIDDVGFYTLLRSYVGSAVLLYLATVRPIVYSLRISVRAVYLFAAGNIVASVLLSVTTAIFQAAVQAEGPFSCDVEHCQPIINVIVYSIIAISFIIPIFTLSFVLITLHFHKNRMGVIGSDTSAFTSARTRLAWTLFTFTLISLSEAIPDFYMVGMKIDSLMGTCMNFYRADHLVIPVIMNSFQILAWSIALIVDPLCGLLFDLRMRKRLLGHVSYVKLIMTKAFCGTNEEKAGGAS
ncbi:hypothetical protein GCK72_021298 [Caenorhabditis remanei]|uniref:G-protein coupled receptors family 1 profile domain-containing protein n=1 Tax=Caenorhabditis remanei TaxID=31234 RepID=A0A6A5GIV6_CAERE|nr:hypothetical protein GCK72_021298 [Caenorhabditis remanei]KAF1754734.1 hypothetical protein GCK72_021298 [Caenorhabditis remanei]